MKCTCPLGSFPTVSDAACSENFGQVQKAVVVDLSQSASVAAAASGIVAAIQTIITAHKALVTPFLQAPTQEAGEARTFGGGNETLGGVEMIMSGKDYDPFSRQSAAFQHTDRLSQPFDRIFSADLRNQEQL